MDNNIFLPADILLYNGPAPEAFSVVACDQYTSEPDYWERADRFIGERPSALRLIFPEVYLKTADFEETVRTINQTMERYLDEGLFTVYPQAFFYTERTLRNGKIRKGIVGMLDLEAYDFSPDSQSPVRATEGTVLERIPPRVRIRQDAPLELPHVMLLIDDRQRQIIEPLALRKDSFQNVYSFPLMEDSGSLSGWLLPPDEAKRITAALCRLADRDAFTAQYGVSDPAKGVLPIAVGDGNHSLATARQCYLNLKERIGAEAARRHPARYALAELVNLHDSSLEFEAIHRIVTGVDPAALTEAFGERFQPSETPDGEKQQVDLVLAGKSRRLYLNNPSRNLPVGSLQDFLDHYLEKQGGEVDYIHGESVVRELSVKYPDSVGFLLPCMKKEELFPTVILDGALPRKTFSMGEACDKRFYWEARRISR